MMSSGYDLLVNGTIVWPYELNDSQKVELLQQAILYFEEIQEYEKCAILRDKITEIFSPKKRTRKKTK